jgi:serine/threonine protein kinase
MVMAKLPFCDKGTLQELLDERKEPPALSHHLSSECVDLILCMLTYNPRNRICLPMIFSHPWLRAREHTQEE